MSSPSSNDVQLLTAVTDRIRSTLFNSPRELSGSLLSAIEKTLAQYEGSDSATIIDKWYRGAEVANYTNAEAAAAYLGAYGPRSILKYQEAIFALLLLKGSLPKKITIADYGAGPCPGFAALVDMWSLISQYSGKKLSLEYIAIDRSSSMLEVGKTFCTLTRATAEKTLKTSLKFLRLDEADHVKADILIVANVLNEGEGYTDCHQGLATITRKIVNLKDIVVIEPATEQPSRQLCSLAGKINSMQHIGPCPSAGNECTEWTFREFKKRVYDFERRCAGQWAPAARTCKYSLALLSSVTVPRVVSEDERVIIQQPSASSRMLTCRHGEKQYVRTFKGTPWDLLNSNRDVIKSFP
jgi:hypothetical protein